MGIIIHAKFFSNGITLVPTTALREDPDSLNFTLDRASVSFKCHAHNQEVAGLDWEPRAQTSGSVLCTVSARGAQATQPG